MKKQYKTPNIIVTEVTVDCHICDPSVTSTPADGSLQLAPQIDFDDIMDFNSNANSGFQADPQVDIWK